jgi:hypothetical protein
MSVANCISKLVSAGKITKNVGDRTQRIPRTEAQVRAVIVGA